MLKAQKTPTSCHWTSFERLMHTKPTSCTQGVAQRHIDTYIHIKVYNKNNPSCRSRTPGTPGTKSHVQIVNNYQSLTITTKNHTPGVTGFVDLLLNLIFIKKTYLIGNLQVANSLEVSFTKFARAVLRNPIFDFWLEKLKGFTLLFQWHN